ncbi:unnamed protein product [Closterium sp. Yama58-4]|nr:unnamed protein product [Closterium sp. Yama58-4]
MSRVLSRLKPQRLPFLPKLYYYRSWPGPTGGPHTLQLLKVTTNLPCSKQLLPPSLPVPRITSALLSSSKLYYYRFFALLYGAVLSSSKLYYYRFFALLYGWAGGHADVTMVNSSWSKGTLFFPPPSSTTIASSLYSTGGRAGTLTVTMVNSMSMCSHCPLPQSPITSAVLSSSKLYYYRFFALLYGWAGGHADVTMVNSSWTEGHIRRIWTRNKPSSVHRVYPPCDTAALQALPLSRSSPGYIISVAQFRPEKNHALQLRAFAQAIKPPPPSDPTADTSSRPDPTASAQSNPDPMAGVRLKLVGSSRHHEDEKRIELLGCLAVSLGIERRVDFIVNTPFRELQQLLGGATCGIHTMWDEHFGISVVEYMAAGAIPIAHNSAGPKMDIVVPACHAGCRNKVGQENGGGEEGDEERDEGGEEELSKKQSEPLIQKGQLEAESSGCPVGFLATTEDEYAAAMRAVFAMSAEERERMATAGRERAKRFSEENFDKSFKDVLGPVLGCS